MASNVLGFLKDKNILVTGSTGFLGKIFMEKILRIQPGIGCIYALLRAEDVESARNRFKKEVMRLELFNILREQHGENFESFIFEKVVPVVGDVAVDHNLGIDEATREHLWENLDAIVNNAASTLFDDRYDTSLNANTKGAANMVEFAKRCPKLQILLHVSTAYVIGHGKGRIMEKPVKMGETITGGNGLENEGGPPFLDIKAEFDLLEKTLAEIDTDSSTTSTSQSSLQDTDTKRLKELGWERTMDTLIVGYGKGRLSSFLADPNLILNVIPADMVVNEMIVAMVAHASQNGLFIYHSASSIGNPLRSCVATDAAYTYFSHHQCVDKDGNTVHVKPPLFLESMSSFRGYMYRRYKATLQMLGLVDNVFCNIFRAHYTRMLRNYNFAIYLAELYEPYVFFQEEGFRRKTEKHSTLT